MAGFSTLVVRAQDLASRADEYMQAQVKDRRFMGSVLVGQNSKVLFARGYGLANAEWNIPNTSRTKFRIGSLTKQFTAAAILLLEEQEKLQTQDPVFRYLSGLPAAWQPITLHQLLTHTAGVPNYTSSLGIFSLNRVGSSPWQLLHLVRNAPLSFPPGTKLAYSNSGYILLGLVVEKTSGESYAAFLQHHIFSPLAMRNSGYDSHTAVLSERAAGYRLKDGRLENADFLDMTVPFAAGGLYSTVEDLFAWSEALAGGRLLSDASRRKMFALYPETAAAGQHYGYGVVLSEKFGQPLYYHGGGIHGFASALQRYPRAGLTVIVLSNVESVKSWDVATGLATLLLQPDAQR